MSPPLIKAQTFFGLKTDISGNAHFITDSEIIYPAGGVLVLHDFNQQQQKFINLPQNQKSIQSISVSLNKQYIALSERGDQKNKPSIKIYDLQTLQLKKSLIIPFEEVSCTEFVTVQFTWDSKYIVAIASEPDWMLYYYNWENGKIESQTKALNPNGQGRVAQINCNPSDANVVVITGPQTFRLLNVSETVWRQWGWTKAENLIITSCMWLTSDKVMFGTKSGFLMMVENGELKQNCCYSAMDVLEISLKKTDEKEFDAMSQSKQDKDLLNEVDVRCLTVFSKGFAFSCKNGYVHMFEKESRFQWTKRNVFKVIDEPFRINEKETVNLNIIQQISVNNSQDMLIVTTLKSQIYYVKLFEQHMEQESIIPFREMGEMLHHSRITGLSMCSWKPIFMTSGEADRSIRLWNYETRKLEFVKFYHENINCVSLHPTGLFAIIGFSDKLRYMVVLIDNLHQVREFSIRNCKVCNFSNNGHMFAAVDGLIIRIFSSVSFNNVYNLKGHSGLIRALSWSGRDDKIVSCGSDGAIYEWCMMTSRRISEIIMKSNDFTGCSVSSDGKSSYIVGIDGEVKEIRNDTIMRNLKIIGVKLDNIVLAHSDMMLFVTGGNGSVVSIQFPLLDKAVFSEFKMHDRNVTAVALSYDDQILISVAEDATMCIWKLENGEGKAIVLSQDFQYSEEILINKNDLREKLTHIQELSKRINEMETEYAYQMRKITITQTEVLNDLHTNYSKEIKNLKEKIEELEAEHLHQKNILQDDITRINHNNYKATEQLEDDFSAKLIHEYDKYELLKNNMAEMKKGYEEQLEKLEKSKIKALEVMQNNYEAQLQEKHMIIKELRDKNQLELQEHEYIKHYIEDDTDREIIEIKTAYETQLREGKHSNVVLKGETDILQKKILASEKVINDYKCQICQLEDELKNFQNSMQILDIKINELKKEISDRDRTIQEKEKIIQTAKQENQSLEKYKFILNFKIEELKKQIEPKNQLILEFQNQIQSLEHEESKMLTAKANTDLKIITLKEKLLGAQIENSKQLQYVYDLKVLFKKVRDRIMQLSFNVQNPVRLKADVKKLLQQPHIKKFNMECLTDVKIEVTSVYEEQKQQYENFITSLTLKLNKTAAKSKKDITRIMEENSKLLENINSLRSELLQLNEQDRKMRILLGLPAARISPIKARVMIDKACADYDNMEKTFNTKIQAKEKEIESLKCEIEEFTNKLKSSTEVSEI